MIIRKEVSKFSDTVAKVSLPAEYAGKFVYILTDDDFDRTYNLLDEAMIKLKIYQERFMSLEKKFDEMYSMMNTRMMYIERVISNTCAADVVKTKAESIESVTKSIE